MTVSVVIPVYNEEKCIEKVVRGYYQEVISRIPDSEFIVVNDCSTDSTSQVLENLSKELPLLKVIKPETNSGHGKALRLGFKNAKKAFVFYTDSDDCFNPKDFWKLYDVRDKKTLISGYRVNRDDPLARLILTRIIRYFIVVVFGVHIKDSNCPFKLIKKDALGDILKTVPEEVKAPFIIISIITNPSLNTIPVFFKLSKTIDS